jgi:hypothetical protein
MRILRGQLRLWVAAWLVFQVTSLSALIPRDCCAAHRRVAANPSCHEPPAVPVCPLHAAHGAPCPMDHAAPLQGHPDGGCAMRGTCDGPMAALSASLWNHGVLPAAFSVPAVRDARPAILNAAEHVISRLASLDPPPPRA